MRQRLAMAGVLLAQGLAAGGAAAYEPARTHAGLTLQAALASGLDASLRSRLGRPLGLLEPLALGSGGAWAALNARVTQLDASLGYTPDRAGRASALAWLEAGSAVAEVPPAVGLLHFLDPSTGRGLDNRDLLGMGERLSIVWNRGGSLWGALAGRDPSVTGESSLDWLADPRDDLGWTAFLSHRERAALAPSAASRDQELAASLVAAGAILHLLEDAGEPSHVRNDYVVAHLEEVPGAPPGRLSPYEDFVAAADGLLGLPPAGPVWRRPRLRDFFLTPKATDAPAGLATMTAARFFSEGTLPRPLRLPASADHASVESLVTAALVRPSPRPEGLDPAAATPPEGSVLAGEGLPALVIWRHQDELVDFSLDDRTRAAYAAALLPVVEGASAGLLDFLFRGSLHVARTATGVEVRNGDLALGRGTLHVLWDDASGMRREITPPAAPPSPAAAGATLADVPAPPPGARRVVAVFVGNDGSGEPLVIEDGEAWPASSAEPSRGAASQPGPASSR